MLSGEEFIKTWLYFITETIKDSIFDRFLDLNIPLYKLIHPSIIKMVESLNIKVLSESAILNCFNLKFDSHLNKIKN